MIRGIIFSFICFAVFSCSKDSNQLNNDYSGTYKGTVIDSINGQYHSTLNNHSITLTRNSGSNNYTITNGLIMTSTAVISGSSFIISEVTAAQSPSFNVIEYANGNFSGTANTTLSVTFYQNQVSPTTNAVLTRAVRKCVFTKQ